MLRSKDVKTNAESVVEKILEYDTSTVMRMIDRLEFALSLRRASSSTVQAAVGPVEDSPTKDPRFYEMTLERENHLVRILGQIGLRTGEKYRAGQKEHGGNLWEKSGLLDMAIDEAIDQLVYLLTIKEQENGSKQTV